ncbi:FAD/NAD(P)-binding domain-containing protein [Annulohypoxylon stygium]|nr:FAD/NAD(P)-binding domain-containing protein [Annulohypoxylon stygium]
MKRMKVLISGGGVAGNALAFWLGKLGHEVTVVEWFPNLRTSGLQIDLRGHGIEVLKRMGLEKTFRSKMAPEQGLQIVNSAGKQQALFPANKSGQGLQNFTTDWEIMRGDLCRLLYAQCKDHTKYIFGTSIESFEEDGNGIEVRLSNGKIERFDLLVGADGIGSKTRKMMLGSNTDDGFTPLRGVYIAYFTISRPIKEREGYLATAYIAPGRRAMMLRRHSPDQVQVYLMCKNDSERLKNAHRDTKEERAALAEIFEGAGWETEELVKAMIKADDFYLEHMGLIKLDSWSRGHVTLVGDAAYCPTANTGMGTTSAIVGAYVLAGEIGKHCKEGVDVKDGLTAALRAYERKFRPFMDQVQKGISENSGVWASMMPTTTFGICIMNFIVWLVALFKLNIIGEWFLREGVKWDLPEYGEILRK